MSITPAGWYPNPSGAPGTRWWDGTKWTDQVQNPYAIAQPLTAPAGTKPYTPFIWLVTLLPLLTYVALAMFDWRSYMRFSMTLDTSLLSTIGVQFLVLLAASWLVTGACWLFAYFDWKEVKRREVPQPFHFAWVFLSPAIYSIGRSVVMRRRTGDGIAPMWATIAVIVLGFVVTIVVTVSATLSLFSEMSTNLPYYG